MEIKKVKAVKFIKAVDCDEEWRVSYKCADCGYEWKQKLPAIPPQISEEQYICGNCWFGKNYEQKPDGYWSLTRKKK